MFIWTVRGMVVHPTIINLIQSEYQLVLVTSGHKITLLDNKKLMKQQYYEVVGTLEAIKCKPQYYLKFEHFLDLDKQ